MADLAARFSELTHQKYIDQAKWYLNGFWNDGAKEEAENIWKYTQKFIELDDKLKKDGTELDEFQAHKFLEFLGETLTVVALRERLRKIDLDCNGKMALLEYLTFKYSRSVKEVIDAPQGDNTEQVNEAAAKLQVVQDSLNELLRQLEQQQRDLDSQKAAEEQVRKMLAKQREAEEAVRKSEAELRAAIDDLKRQEDAYQTQLKTLESKSTDPSASTVSKSKAAAELAQLKQEDPLPLRKAKITQEAALRKVEKERKAAEAATASAEAAAREAQSKTKALEEQTKRVEAAVRDTEDAVKEAEDYLEQVKKRGGASHGSIWFMQRELQEAQKYLPKRKQQL